MKKIIITAILSINLFAVAMSVNAQEYRITKADVTGLPEKHDMFGWQVSQDNKFVFVSCPHDDIQKTNSGSLSIYSKENNGLLYRQHLTVPVQVNNTMFSQCFAHDENYLIVTSKKIVNTNVGVGNIFIYKYQNSSWTLVRVQQFKVDNTLIIPFSIVMSGQRIIISSQHRSNNFKNGLVQYYNLNTTSNQLELAQNITMSGLEEKDMFGDAIAIDQNYLLISSTSVNGTSRYNGKVWLYKFNGLQWDLKESISSQIEQEHQRFGSDVTIDYPYFAIGALKYKSSAGLSKKAGAAFVYKINASDIPQLEATLFPDNSINNYDYFGSALSLNKNELAISAHGDDFAGKNTGAIYIFKRDANSWQQVNKTIGSNVNNHAYFGCSLSLLDGNLVAGSHLEENDTSKVDHGAVYYYKSVSNPVGIKIASKTNDHLLIYPNPARERFAIEIKETESIESLEIYALSGQLVQSYSNDEWLKNNSKSIDIVCKDWAEGIYIVSVKYKSGGAYNARLMKRM